MTERLYYHDAFLREFDAQVLSCEPDDAAEPGKGRWRVVVDRTAFYPTSGGQPHDLGTLAGAPVVEVADAKDHGVVHYTSAAVPVGPAHAEIDWTRRFDHMQQHTGQHLLSAVFIELFQFQTVSFHLGREISTIDLTAPSVVPRHLAEAERRANDLIFEDRAVAVRFGTAEELAAAGIRKDVNRRGVLRAIEIQDLDLQPCGGTHLSRTGQAGLLLIRGIERRRDAYRVEFVCGFRALAAARRDFAALSSSASLLTCGPAEVPGAVERLTEERRAQHGAAKRLEETLADYQARALLASATPPAGRAPGPGNVPNGRLIAVALTEAAASYLKLLAARIVALAAEEALEVTVALAGASSGAVVLAQSAGSSGTGGRDLGQLLRNVLTEFAGKGGGSASFAQGSLGEPGKASEFIERMKRELAGEPGAAEPV